MLKSYVSKLFEVANRGDAREESYYASLEWLLNNFAKSIKQENINITTLPKKTEAGNPDFRVWDGKQHIVGYIEAKAPTVTNLDQVEDSEQLVRYKHTFPNLLLTNFCEFRLYRNGDIRDKVSIARPFILNKLQTTPPVEKQKEFLKLLEGFLAFSLPKVYDSETLAIELAKRTRFLKDEVIAEELKEAKKGRGFILGFYEAFRKYLISGLTKEDFADLYSQTITYGLFAARTRSKNGFNRKLAYDNIPQTIGILRDVFRFISLEDVPTQMEWIIDDISEVLEVTDVNELLKQFYHEGKGKDPIIHFYETFLEQYDPETREKRGVYYTPEPVVSYIVHSIHNILKEYYGRTAGFASDSVTVLDPAAGTLTFLAQAADLAIKEFVSRYGDGGKGEFIKKHILKNFYAFELMMAPYAIGHLKMSFLLEEIGYRLQEDERFKFYLTNTLEMDELSQTELPGMSSLSEESHLAGKVKKDQPILVILGNPPYSSSTSTGTVFINEKIKDYLKGLGVENEKKKGVIQDDYIRFIRFAQWKINQNDKGILGFITNNSYLDGTNHRSMRKQLIDSFDKIYILNLHGNARIKEISPDGSKDENVFDIQQGVCIGLFIQTDNSHKAEIYYQDLWGMQNDKYTYLDSNHVKTTKWTKLSPEPPYFFLTPKDLSLEKTYNRFIKVTEIFLKYSSGIETEKDKFAVAFEKPTLKNRLLSFSNPKADHELISATFKLKDTPNWNIKRARKQLNEFGIDDNLFINYCYHVFDYRWTYFSDIIITRTRKPVMLNMFEENLALLTMRQVKGEEYKHCFVTSKVSNKFTLSSKSSNVSYHFPLYIYSGTNKKDLFSHLEESNTKEPNISPKLLSALSMAYSTNLSVEDLFYYIYAVLYSDVYRARYGEFLKIDFPRLPIPKDLQLFTKIAKLGAKLVEIHLLESPDLDPPISRFKGTGDNKVERIKYDDKLQILYISENQYFSNIDNSIWEYEIGGYQVCHKWLKDRKDKKLSLDEIKHYCRVVTALKKTIEIQNQIDEIYSEVENNLLDIN